MTEFGVVRALRIVVKVVKQGHLHLEVPDSIFLC